MDMLGINIGGKLEALHAAMRFNTERGFDNAEVLNLFDIGSLHALRQTSKRSLYNMSKNATLALCRLLVRGAEVRRAIHVAPGKIDTPMLHWNHWVLKENGDPEFLESVRKRFPELYPRIFRDCDLASLNKAISLLNLEGAAIRTVFEKYSHLRKMIWEMEDGLTSPETLAAYLSSLVLQDESPMSGVVEVTSPNRRLKTTFVPF
jgi:hypothetical protein